MYDLKTTKTFEKECLILPQIASLHNEIPVGPKSFEGQMMVVEEDR
jgi:hypothetical protein